MKLLLCALFSLFFLLPIHAQRVEQLQEKLKQGETRAALEAILEAGESGDRSYIPYLKELSSRSETGMSIYSIPSFAQIALAKMGQEPYLSSIISDLDDDNIFMQDRAIQRLAKVGGKPAFKNFYRLLDDTEYRTEKVTKEDLATMREIGASGLRKGDEVLEPRSFLVMKLLATLVEKPPVEKVTNPSKNDIPLWKAWFEDHKELIQ